jgi:hypothetical protein
MPPGTTAGVADANRNYCWSGCCHQGQLMERMMLSGTTAGVAAATRSNWWSGWCYQEQLLEWMMLPGRLKNRWVKGFQDAITERVVEEWRLGIWRRQWR